MPINQKIFAGILALIFFVIVMDLARRKKLRVEYSILWSLTAGIILVLVFWYDSLVFITGVIGAVLPTTTLFIYGLMFLLFLNLHFSVKLSDLSEQVKNLGQEFAIRSMNEATQNRHDSKTQQTQ